MDAVGSTRAALIGTSEGAPISIMFAATYPERVSHLILFGCFARFTATADYPFRRSSGELTRRAEHWAQFWGTGVSMEGFLPSRAKQAEVREQYAKLERLTFSPGALRLMYQYNMEIDVRSVLPLVQVPILVLHRRADALAAVENGRFVADHIPGAKLIEYEDCKDHLFFAGDWQPLCGDIEEFVNGFRTAGAPAFERVLATVLFTDICDSTMQASSLGDAVWRRILDDHDRTAERMVARHRGTLVKTTDDGILATFDGPGRAIRCALALTAAVARMGLQLRASLHTGEIEKRGRDVSGIAVHTGGTDHGRVRSGRDFGLAGSH
jgi:hypothetical protein